MILTALTRELQERSAEAAATIISAALASSCDEAIDRALFGAATATEDAPGCILYGVEAIAQPSTICSGEVSS